MNAFATVPAFREQPLMAIAQTIGTDEYWHSIEMRGDAEAHVNFPILWVVLEVASNG